MQSISKKDNYFIGTLSGTSMDAIDASIYKITNKIKLVDSISHKMPKDLKAKLFSLSKSKKICLKILQKLLSKQMMSSLKLL